MMNKFSREKMIAHYIPPNLKSIDWTILAHRRIITASLVKGVYLHERDRQMKKKVAEYEPVAPVWWETFNFRHVEDIIDESLHFHSIFGSIFEYKPPNNTSQHHNISSQHRPPKYVIAFRGTLLKKRTVIKDLCLDAKLLLNLRTRYKSSLKPVHDMIEKVGSGNVWLTGHSLGAAIALQVGKTMGINGHYIESYLFNPPYCSSPIELLSIPELKLALRMARNVVTAGAVALKSVLHRSQSSKTSGGEDAFTMLSSWTPYLFVNGHDPISCEYIGYFEHREKMKSIGVCRIQKCIAKYSIISVGSCFYGGNAEALHQIPSAFLVKNRIAKEPHNISQWWDDDSHLDLETKLYMFSSQMEGNKTRD